MTARRIDTGGAHRRILATRLPAVPRVASAPRRRRRIHPETPHFIEGWQQPHRDLKWFRQLDRIDQLTQANGVHWTEFGLQRYRSSLRVLLKDRLSRHVRVSLYFVGCQTKYVTSKRLWTHRIAQNWIGRWEGTQSENARPTADAWLRERCGGTLSTLRYRIRPEWRTGLKQTELPFAQKLAACAKHENRGNPDWFIQE